MSYQRDCSNCRMFIRVLSVVKLLQVIEIKDESRDLREKAIYLARIEVSWVYAHRCYTLGI